MHDIQAITFDVGGTLIEPWPSIGHIYAFVAREHGMEGLSPDELTQRFLSAWAALNRRAESKEEWAAIVQATFAGLGPFNDPTAFFEALYSRFAESSAWRVFHDVVPALDALRQRNIALGVLSNWDNRLRPLLDRLELARFFEVMVISCETGCRKPDRRIFHAAARAFDLSPGQILHIGDSYECDVEGAAGAGLYSVGIQRATARPGAKWVTRLTDLLSWFE